MNKMFYNVFEKFCTKYNITVVKENNGEYYFAPAENKIHLGDEEIESLKNVYKMFHEASHATSNIDKRNISNYALEEVVADISASQILAKLFKVYDDWVYNSEIQRLMIMNISYSSCWAERVVADSQISIEDLLDSIKKTVNSVLKKFEQFFNDDEQEKNEELPNMEEFAEI